MAWAKQAGTDGQSVIDLEILIDRGRHYRGTAQTDPVQHRPPPVHPTAGIGLPRCDQERSPPLPIIEGVRRFRCGDSSKMRWRLLMNELTERLTVEQQIVMGGADPTIEELRERTGEMGYVLVKFTETRGGTELGFPLDREATDLSGTNFDEGTGSVHVEGNLILNDDPVRCIADIDLATLKGTGRLKLEEKVAAAAE